MADLPLPAHYDPRHATQARYAVRDVAALLRAAQAWRWRHRIPPAADDRARVHLLVVDDQVDFSFPEGALYVAGRTGAGAMDAHRNLVEFIYHNLHRITAITCTLDTHLPFQVFFPAAHLREDGTHPEPHTIVSADEYRRGVYRPNPAVAAHLGVEPEWLRRQFIHYCEQLEATGKYQLYLWPPHCLLGSDGHRLAGVVEEARLFHAYCRGADDPLVIKGTHPLTEHYSVFRPEVTTTHEGGAIEGAAVNTGLLDTLLAADALVVAGEASSHCVRESLTDLLAHVRRRDPTLARTVYILEDCMAPVVVPGGRDFTDDAEAALRRVEEAGMHRVRSTVPIAEWGVAPARR